MTLEELSNYEILILLENTVKLGDFDYVLEIREEIFSRMEGGNEGAN